MGDLLEQAAAWLADQRRQHLSHAVMYGRAGSSVQILATVGSTTFDVTDDLGVVEQWESRDFLVVAADLVLAGQTIVPQRGDRITDGGKVYQVLAPDRQAVYRPSDPYGKTLRIHTKQVQ